MHADPAPGATRMRHQLAIRTPYVPKSIQIEIADCPAQAFDTEVGFPATSAGTAWLSPGEAILYYLYQGPTPPSSLSNIGWKWLSPLRLLWIGAAGHTKIGGIIFAYPPSG